MGKERLLRRLDEIGEELNKREGVLVLLGLGSVGRETDRIDEYSDLDFFVIVKPGYKNRFVDQLDWLEAVYPLAYTFLNYEAGYKILFEDGIYGEFAVFEETDLEHVAYAEGRIVWKDPAYDNDAIVIAKASPPSLQTKSTDFVLNEALTNLYVGLGRYARGEKLSAAKFVQQYAFDNILYALHVFEEEVDFYPDPFGNDRRIERRYPAFANNLSGMLQGYDKVPESALCLLRYLEQIYPVNKRLSEEIRRLAEECSGR